MKLALVVQRYGSDITGGSEAHCRAIAHRLARHHDVDVLTTTARDYVTWSSEHQAGQCRDGAVRVLRFPTRPRDLERFEKVSRLAFAGELTPEEENEWFLENGPVCPDLLAYLEESGGSYDRVLFWTFRYYPSYFGLPLVADRAILLPTAEEDGAVGLGVLSEYFVRPRGVLFLTEEEKQLVAATVAEGSLPSSRIIGAGLDPPAHSVEAGDRLGEILEAPDPFVLYLGRVDPNKGCDVLLRYFLRFAERTGTQVPLVMAGRSVLELPRHPLVRPLGFVSDAEREALLARARLVIMPSALESLCLVILEAWNHRRPVLVNGGCRVLRGQVRRANGGLYYQSYEEFAEGLELLLARRDVADRLGGQGFDYVERHYRWPVVMAKIEAMLEETGRSRL